ncbi:MAG: RsmB/NOP family class I SAM-dependent RNA methyltransferase [Desulfovibrionaceae bacterium]|nr:RsmB/NOP family class I SAM-dependent RNA methyltransferase [Desulfovibrionaceae bacterium]
MSVQKRSFRFVCAVNEISEVSSLLHAQGFEFEPEPFSPLACRLTKEPFPLGRSLAAFWGYIYIQDRSSMLPPLALAPSEGEIVLDMCASPGSKTGFLAQLTGNSGLVIGNEVSPDRLITLRRNLGQMNLLQTVTCAYSGEKLPFPDAFFDRILLDPPCSGWGTTDKHPQAVKIWQGDRIDPLIRIQRSLLREAARLLRPGGRMVYSTCTTNRAENEDAWLFAVRELGLEPLFLNPFPGFVFAPLQRTECEGTLRVDEQASEAQGFYVAALRRPETECGLPQMEHTESDHRWNRAVHPLEYKDYGLDPDQLPQGMFASFGDILRFLPEQAVRNIPGSVKWQGMAVGRCAGNRISFSPRFRCAVSNDAPRIVLESASDLEKLIQGQSLRTSLSEKNAILCWNSLVLGRVRLKNGRIVWSER